MLFSDEEENNKNNKKIRPPASPFTLLVAEWDTACTTLILLEGDAFSRAIYSVNRSYWLLE